MLDKCYKRMHNLILECLVLLSKKMWFALYNKQTQNKCFVRQQSQDQIPRG